MGNCLLWPQIAKDESKYNNHYFTSCCACLDKAFIILLCLSNFTEHFSFSLFNCHANSHQQETKLNKLLYPHKKCV